MCPNRLITLSIAALAAATLVSGAALAKDTKANVAPKNLRAFLLTPTEPVSHTFSRTPAFAWNPVPGALCYEFELATSRTFAENAIVWSNVRYGVKPGTGCKAVPAVQQDTTTTDATATPGAATPGATAAGSGTPTGTDEVVTTLIQPLKVPAVSVDVALPWFTGKPYALYSHVRAITRRGPTGWSKPFAFNTRWPSVPTPLGAPSGLVRWTKVSGATGYQVWFPALGKSIAANTNIADLRDFATLRAPAGPATWRVRAVRRVFGNIPNGLPAVSYGPWSPVYSTEVTSLSSGPLTTQLAISDRVSDGSKQAPHELMPGLSFAGNQGLNGTAYSLFRVYVSTDQDCVNTVFVGSVTGTPAFAPRTTGRLALDAKLPAKDGAPTAGEFSVDWRLLTTNEGSPNTTSDSSSSQASADATGTDSTSSDETPVGTRVSLPDIDFPTTRYYWTVVPVQFETNPSDGREGWHDLESPQDACAAGRIESFGKESDPVVTGDNGKPFVAGLTPNGRLLASASRKPQVFSTPLVAWMPATGATAYQVQWSRTKYPWRAQGSKTTYSTSAVLDLAAGQWYYRVRGLNQTQLKKPEMSWSAPVELRVAKPKFRLVSSR